MIWAVLPPTLLMRAFVAIAIAVLLLVRLPVQAADLIYVRFADYLESLRLQTGIPGLAAAIVGPSEVLWEGGFGYQNVERALPMRPDTPVHIDGLTQLFTAVTLLRCAEEGRLTLDDPIGWYVADTPEPAATIRDLLSHTSLADTGLLTFSYLPERLDVLAEPVQRCQEEFYWQTLAPRFEQLAMIDSIPGVNVLGLLAPGANPVADQDAPGDQENVSRQRRERYAEILTRLATPYTVDDDKRFTPVVYPAVNLTASRGVVSSVRDLARFDLALRSGVLVLPESLAAAWQPRIDSTGRALPHGMGWFVRAYNGELVAWQYGTGGEQGASSLVITLPARGVTLILLANSTGLVKSFPLANGDVTTSPFGRAFLALFTK